MRNRAGAIGRAVVGGNQTDEAIAADGFKPESIKVQAHGRLLCTWLEPAPPLHEPYARKVAERDFDKAKAFLGTAIPTESESQLLFEDIETAFIVRLFKDSDKPCFYMLSQFKTTINRNVGKLSALFSLIVSAVVIANVRYAASSDCYPLFAYFDLAKYLPLSDSASVHVLYGLFEVGKTDVNMISYAAVSSILGIFIMWMFYGRRLEPYQTHNGLNMRNYLPQYMIHITEDFKEIHSVAVGVVQGQRGSEAQQKRDTVLYITNLQWMAFRAFFIEVYLRNIIFQIQRNTYQLLDSLYAAIFCARLLCRWQYL